MKKLILIDEIQIGQLFFSAYVVEDENSLPAFAIFLDKLDDPLIIFNQIPNSNKIEITVAVHHYDYLQKHKTKDKKSRQLFFKNFYQFIKETEFKASKTIFKDKKMEYIKDFVVFKKVKASYIND